MPKIVITEQDLTKTGGTSEDFDVVYVPGLVDTTQSSLKDDNEKYIGIEVNKPMLFTSVKEFVSLCGDRPARFEADQLYSDLKVPEYSEDGDLIGYASNGFKDSAVPYHRTMFKKGDYDPSYIIAKELLNAGLCVLFERINGEATFEPVVAEPADWAVAFNNYYTFGTEKRQIDSVSAPLFYGEFVSVVDNEGKAPAFVANKYYDVAGDDTTVALADTPVDWETNYTAYFTREPKKYYKAVGDNNYAEIGGVRPADWDTKFYNYYEEYQRIVPIAEESAPEFTKGSIFARNDGINVPAIYRALEGVYTVSGYEGLHDLGNYSVKYLTSGGYPTYEYNGNSIVTKMIALAEKRGDCVALIDHTDNEYRQSNIDLVGSIYHTVKNDVSLTQSNGEFAAMFTPWATYNRTTSDRETQADGSSIVVGASSLRGSGSYAYLIALADSIKTNAPWLAIAGAARGVVLNLAEDGLTTIIPNGAADAMQPRSGLSVNAITEIKPYGNVIWGNRTLKNNGENLTATSFLNIRNLVSDVKKIAYRAARKLTYEQNNDVLWINFKAELTPTLDRMLSGYGISGYKFVRDFEHEKAREKATLCAKIVLYPVYPVEDFYITIVLEDDEITVE